MDGAIRVSSDHERRYKGARKLATETVINLVRAESLVRGALDRGLRKHGLTTPTFNVLMILEGSPVPLCPWEIGERLLVTRGTVTGLLDSLERLELIRRVPNPDDRRSLRIELTSKAKPLLKKVWAEHFPSEVELTKGLSQREQAELVRLLGKLQTCIEPS
jgi:DNA-binding MarR family transcriptional regulator